VTQLETGALVLPPNQRWARRVLEVVGPFLAAPFAATGLLRLDLPSWGVVLLCALAVPLALITLPRQDARRLVAGWTAGCVLHAAFLLWLLSAMSSGMAELGS